MNTKFFKQIFLLKWFNKGTILFAALFVPIISPAAIQYYEAAEMWWCAGCGLAYPASQKCCLNKDCPLFMKRK